MTEILLQEIADSLAAIRSLLEKQNQRLEANDDYRDALFASLIDFAKDKNLPGWEQLALNIEAAKFHKDEQKKTD